jgi:hypothetical protein
VIPGLFFNLLQQVEELLLTCAVGDLKAHGDLGVMQLRVGVANDEDLFLLMEAGLDRKAPDDQTLGSLRQQLLSGWPMAAVELDFVSQVVHLLSRSRV